jgi:hypothetical protein
MGAKKENLKPGQTAPASGQYPIIGPRVATPVGTREKSEPDGDEVTELAGAVILSTCQAPLLRR